MIIEETFSVNAPRTEVAQFFLDVPRMGRCVPGVEGLQHVDDCRYEATFVVRVGPIQARFNGDVTIDDSGAPETIVAIANGRDIATGSVARVSFTAQLIQSGEGSTEIRTAADVSIRGRLGEFGAGVLAITAREMVRTFADCAGHEIGTEAQSGAGSPEAPGFTSVVARGVLSYLRQVWARLFDRRPQDRRSRG